MAPMNLVSADLIDLNRVNSVMRNALQSSRFVVKKFGVYKAGDGLLGFLGDHYKVKVTYVFEGREAELQVFLKTLPKHNATRAGYNTEFGLFDREILAYNEIFSQFEEVIESKECIPKCFYAHGDDLFFEDLNMRGFKMLDLRQSRDKAHIHVVMKALARLHCSSIILVDKRTKENKKTYDLHEAFGKAAGDGCFSDNRWYSHSIVECLHIAGFSKKYGRETIYFNKIKAQWEDLFIRARKQLEPSKEYCNVVVHSDLWCNNLMYRYDDNGQPAQCMLVDYQSSRICPPATDILSFLYMNLDKTLREECFEEFIHTYYQEFQSVLQDHKVDIERYLPWNSFVKSCEEFRLFGLMINSILCQFIFMDETDVACMMQDSIVFEKLIYTDRKELMAKNLKNDEMFRQRILDTLEELIELYILK